MKSMLKKIHRLFLNNIIGFLIDIHNNEFFVRKYLLY